MSDGKRIRRPRPERTEPIRNWSTMFGAAPPAEGAPAAGMADVVQRSVDLAYRVVDEYVRQGQRAAQRLSGRSGGPETAVGDVQDATAQMTRLASDGLRIWFELLGLAMAGGASAGLATPGAAAAPPAPTGAAAHTPAGSGEATRVRLEITTRQPVDVAVDLRPEAASAELVAHALRSADAEVPPLSGATFVRDPASGALALQLAIPDAQPAGIYNGLVIDARSNRPVGTLSARVGGG